MFTRNSVLAGDNETNTEYFGRVQVVIENKLLPVYVDIIALWNTWQPLGL